MANEPKPTAAEIQREWAAIREDELRRAPTPHTIPDRRILSGEDAKEQVKTYYHSMYGHRW